MPRKKTSKLTKTEESVFTLISLFVLMEQAFQSITGKEEILDSNYDYKEDNFHDLVTDTIYEALVYQILLKTCAFMDEWNETFGIKTEPEYQKTILLIKSIAKPASRQIKKWAQLREFRNEAIAHNHRDRQGNNIYLNSKRYNAPEGPAEVYLMLYCMKKMLEVVSVFLSSEIDTSLHYLQTIMEKKSPKNKRMSKIEIKRVKKELDENIGEKVSRIIMREKILEAYSANSIKS